MTNLHSILKSRDITLPTKARLDKAMVFLVVMYGCESWTVKKAEQWRTDAFELWCWRRLLRVPWRSKEIQPVHPKGDQSWVFIGRTDAEAETPVLWPPHAKSWFIGKDPDAGRDWGAAGEGDDRGWDGWMASPTQWTWVWVNSRSWWLTGRPGVLQSVGLLVSDTTEWQNCTEHIPWAFPPVSFLACFSIGLELHAWSFSLVKSLWNFSFEKASPTLLANANGTLNLHPSS